MPIRLVTESSKAGKLYTQEEVDQKVKNEREACALEVDTLALFYVKDKLVKECAYVIRSRGE